MLQSPEDSQAATLAQVSAEAASAVPAATSGKASPAPPAVTVSDARLILLCCRLPVTSAYGHDRPP